MGNPLSLEFMVACEIYGSQPIGINDLLTTMHTKTGKSRGEVTHAIHVANNFAILKMDASENGIVFTTPAEAVPLIEPLYEKYWKQWLKI